MTEGFQIRRYAAGTQKNYFHYVARFSQHSGQSDGTE